MAEKSTLVFSRGEYERRLGAVRDKMKQQNVAVLILDQEQHLAYLTGFSTRQNFYQAALIPLDSDPFMIVRNVDETKFLEQSWVKDCTVLKDWDDPVAALGDTARKRGWDDKRIGVELSSNYLTAKRYLAIKDGLPRATFVDLTDAISEVPLRKSPEEIALLREAAAIADAATLSAIDAAGEGKNEREAVFAGAKTQLDMGADADVIGFITSGKRAEVSHARLGDHRLQKGDILFTEFMPQVKGYAARIIRSAVIGEPSLDRKEATKRLIDIQDQQFAAMKPGAIGKDVDRIVREQVVKAGLRDEYLHNVGYTLGYLGPTAFGDFTRFFLPNSEWALEEGMVFHMIVRGAGMAFSETVLVTENGHERLTKLDRKLYVR